MVQQKLGSACKGMAVEHGIAGMTPGSPPAFIAMGSHLLRVSGDILCGLCTACRLNFC